MAMALLALAGCAAQAPAPPGPALVAPDAQDLLQDKAHAFQAGVAAGERLQARRDEAALTGARAALVAETTASSCPAAAPPTAAPPAPPIPPVKSVPDTAPSPTYAPGGPAVAVAPAN
jgi:hypothetical protein